ncbi:MAG TPA: YceI family protein [Candidatus Polarisedimenticolaceae bacterium]|nr:YceI family protein [Candidatus Polarisedimenticolaceae bacterium]
MKRSFRILLLGALALAVFAGSAGAASWTIDPAHSAASFSVKHLMVSTVRGGFGKLTGTVEWDGKDLATIKAEATIDATTISTGQPDRDKHLNSPDFFDTAKFPTITFKSKRALPGTAGHFKLVGDLTIHGVTKEVTLDVEGPSAELKDPWGNIKVGASATTKVNRQDFGVTWNKTLDGGGVVVSDEVTITIDLELGRKAG